MKTGARRAASDSQRIIGPATDWFLDHHPMDFLLPRETHLRAVRFEVNAVYR